MFPMAIILGVGVYRKENIVAYYALPFSVGGMIIASYHSLLQWGVIKEVVMTCTIDSSCAIPQINWFGFVTIPFMALIAFLVLSVLLIWQIQILKISKKRKNSK